MDNVLLQIVQAFSTDGFYAYGNIPAKKLENAIQHYPVDLRDTVIGLIDTTVMGSAKTGMAIGLKGIYWTNDWTTKTSKKFLSWDELAESNVQISCSTFDLQFGAGAVFCMSGSSMKKNQAINLLTSLIGYYKELKYTTEVTRQSASDNSAQADVSVIALPNYSSDNGYIEALILALALITCADGNVEEDEVEAACGFLEEESNNGNQEASLATFSDTINILCAEKAKSTAFFKLKAASYIARLKNVSSAEMRERILIMVDSMVELSASENAETIQMGERIRAALA